MTHYITKEEFGLDLYEAVFTIGQLLGVQNKVRFYHDKNMKYPLRAAQQEEQTLRTTLTKQMDKLSDADAAEIVRRYPWILVTS